jgi:hypothetical protein
MTHNALMRLLLLAAGAGITTTEFRSFVDAIHDADAIALSQVYNEIRKRLRNIEIFELKQIDLEFEATTPFKTVRQDILQLAKRANIKSSEAAERIQSKLLSMPNINQSVIPVFDTREGLGRWLERVARSVGASTLLNAAISAIAPENANDPQKWRLSRQ